MINKNISIWRGNATPPTNYHLWEKEDGGLYVYVDEKWQHLVAPNDKTILDEHLQQLNKIKDLAITEVAPTNTNTYKSYLLKSGDNIFGTTIDIPKDKFIKLATLGYSNATIDTSTGNINIGTGLTKEYLLFSITLDTGNYELISINLSEFITEKDYSDGLEVVDNKLKVKVDPNSEEYLKVTNNGIKVEGINTNFNKINEKLATISNTQIKRSEMGVANGVATLDNNGTIPYNLLPAIADDEDLIEVNNRLKLKDKVYDPDNFSGKGYVILRKNIVEGKNILTQDMINKSNTVYEIRYDFDLNDVEITIPENCVLKFNGGSLSNGVLVGNYTLLTNFDYKRNTCGYKGNFINTEPIYIENFTELENYNIPIGTKLTLTGENPVIAIRRATSNNNEVLWENKDGQKYLYNSSTLIVDHFGCKPNNKDLIDSNSRIIEKLTQYRLPIKFLSGTYYLRNIDLNLYKQRVFSFVGIEFDAFGLSGIDNKNSAIDTDGSDLFLTFTSIESMHSIRLFWLKFKSKDLTGKVIKVVSEKAGTDICLEAQDCYFQGFDAVIRSKYYGTGLTIKNCTFRNCRTGISFEYACNLAYLFGCNFLNVGQCIRVHGTNAMIIKTEMNCLYTGDDWETLELYCFYTAYNCKIDQVYFETYGQHDSIYRFNILITYGGNLTKIIANYMQFPRVAAEPNKRITHVKVKNINPNYPYNHAKLLFVGTGDSATNDISNYPSFIKGEDKEGNALDIFATNILYNGKAITGTKYILSGIGGIPLSLKETNMLTENKNLEKFSLYYPSNSQSVNKYNELIPESLRNNAWYYDSGYFCLMLATYNLDMTLNVTNSPNGLIDIYLNYRTPQAVREYIYLGTCNIINGKAKFRTTLNNIVSGGQWFNITIGKQPDNDAYAKINGGTPFECTLKLDMTPV